MIDFKEVEKYAESKGIKIFIDFDVDECSLKLLFEKFGRVRRAYIPESYSLDKDNLILIMKRVVDEADKMLSA